MWHVKMNAILIKEKCWKVVTGDYPGDYPGDMSPEAKQELDLVAHSEIMIRISNEVARQVIHCETVKTLWS